jgi:hypothetical protein
LFKKRELSHFNFHQLNLGLDYLGGIYQCWNQHIHVGTRDQQQNRKRDQQLPPNQKPPPTHPHLPDSIKIYLQKMTAKLNGQKNVLRYNCVS